MKKAGIIKKYANRLLTGLAGVFIVSAAMMAAGALRPSAAYAEVPVKFTYQGNLRQSGFLVNGQRSMVFRVYDSSTAAAELWTSPAYDVTLSTGVFRVNLEPVIADWQSGNLWLELEIEGNRMAPREELTSSPYAINSLLLSGKRYTSAAAAPAGVVPGDLWYDSAAKLVSFWDGAAWLPTSGSGLPGAHAATHAGAGADPITALGTHTVTGYITVSSGVSAAWFSGDGSGLYNLDASRISLGTLSGDRIGNVIVSTHITDGAIQNQDIAPAAINKDKLAQSGCASGEILQWGGSAWVCGSGAAAGLEVDPLSIHNQDTLQSGTTFYVSSGTVNSLNAGTLDAGLADADSLNVNNSLTVQGTAQLRGAPGEQGLLVNAAGNVGIGAASSGARLEVKGSDAQAYSLAVGTGTAHQVVVSTSGAVGIGTENPAAKLDVTGGEGSGEYIAVFNSGTKIAAWLRNK